MEYLMATYCVGWDVGAWHCDKNTKSKDCIYVIDSAGKKIFEPKRQCVRNQLKTNTICEFLNTYFNEKRFTPEDTIIFAIDAVFRWPNGLQKLFCDVLPDFPDNNKAIENVMLYRYTEKKVSKNHMALSAVQHMIGSQSTKIMYFLQKYEFKQGNELGVWKTNAGKIKAIETYPALLAEKNTKRTDIEDAKRCATLAMQYECKRNELCCPENEPEEYLELNRTFPTGETILKTTYLPTESG